MKLVAAAVFLISTQVLAVLAKDPIPDLDNSIFESIPASENCPDVQYKCPECPYGSVCIYPDSGGCKNAGIPVCQSIHCFGILCLTRRLPCPKECPFTCRYKESLCCPFIGEPLCEQPCVTPVPCTVTPCPKECPNDCYYPNADYCCPKSGRPVCKTKKKPSLPSPSSSVNNNITSVMASLQVRDDGVERHQYEGGQVDEKHHLNKKQSTDNTLKKSLDRRQMLQEKGSIMCANYIIPCPVECPHSCIYPMEASCPFTHQPSCPSPLEVQLNPEKPQTLEEEGMLCAQHIVPCPEECPNSCVYPMDTPCPFIQSPSCPIISEQQRQPKEHHDNDYDSIYNSKGHPYPYFPTYDAEHTVFTSIVDKSDAPSFVTEAPTEFSDYLCPLMLVLCPPECRDSCLRHDVPCPFATEGYCPGTKPTILSVAASATPATAVPEEASS